MQRFLLPALILTGVLTVAIIGCGKEPTDGSTDARNPELNAPQTVLTKETDVIFTGEEDHSITLQAAQVMMTAFQDDNPYNVYAWYFSKAAVQKLLAQEGCVGIRIYGGLNQDNQFSPVVFGVTAPGDDIGGRLSKALLDSTGVGPMEQSIPCPPYCL
ncbi:MAG: hypothetical protein ACETWG_08825 [Candidatus Neomarinimicrobiota bacterium]